MTSKITSKGQTTIPLEIRKRLRVRPGDSLLYELEGDSVRLRKLTPLDRAWHEALSATLDEWASPEDDEAFRDL